MKNIILLLLLIIIISLNIRAQNLSEPNYALKTPQTLEVINIELTEDLTVIYISIENQIEGGYFCIDRNTYLVTDREERVKMSELIGLPLCPESYKFTMVGEKKYVTMKFPGISKESGWIDLVEDCGDNCLAVYGLILDLSLNERINICFRELDNGRQNEAIALFESLREDLMDSNNPLLGSIYLNLITLYEETGNSEAINKLKTEFESSLFPHKERFVSIFN